MTDKLRTLADKYNNFFEGTITGHEVTIEQHTALGLTALSLGLPQIADIETMSDVTELHPAVVRNLYLTFGVVDALRSSHRIDASINRMVAWRTVEKKS